MLQSAGTRGTALVGVEGCRGAGRWVLAPATWTRPGFPSALPSVLWLRGAEGPMGGVDPQCPSPHRPGCRGEALASVSGPSAGHVQCGLNSQDSSLPSWPLPVLFLTGAPALTPLPFWVYQTLEEKQKWPPTPKVGKLSPSGIRGAPRFHMKTRSCLSST